MAVKYQRQIEKNIEQNKRLLKRLEDYAVTCQNIGVVAFAQFVSMSGKEKFL